MLATFCAETPEGALAGYCKPQAFNIEGSKLTGAAVTGAPASNGNCDQQDGKGVWRDNVFVEWGAPQI
jgi:hypothetical protein